MSKKEVNWLINTQGIRTIVTIKEKPLSQEWLSYNNGTNTGGGSGTKIDYLHISVQDYGAPSLEELDYVVNYISQQIDRTRPVMVHCSGGKEEQELYLLHTLSRKRMI